VGLPSVRPFWHRVLCSEGCFLLRVSTFSQPPASVAPTAALLNQRVFWLLPKCSFVIMLNDGQQRLVVSPRFFFPNTSLAPREACAMISTHTPFLPRATLNPSFFFFLLFSPTKRPAFLWPGPTLSCYCIFKNCRTARSVRSRPFS